MKNEQLSKRVQDQIAAAYRAGFQDGQRSMEKEKPKPVKIGDNILSLEQFLKRKVKCAP